MLGPDKVPTKIEQIAYRSMSAQESLSLTVSALVRSSVLQTRYDSSAY
jgi:hypothetical protein